MIASNILGYYATGCLPDAASNTANLQQNKLNELEQTVYTTIAHDLINQYCSGDRDDAIGIATVLVPKLDLIAERMQKCSGITEAGRLLVGPLREASLFVRTGVPDPATLHNLTLRNYILIKQEKSR